MKLDEPVFGNYFVATYPPFFFWRAAEVEAALADLEEPAEAGRRLGLYVHIPFCVERCQYCYYLSYSDRAGEQNRYVEALLCELEGWVGRLRLCGGTLDYVYFGGGTPSVLGDKQLKKLLDGLQQVLPWSDVREVTFECAPRSVSEAKVSRLREAGVTRVSLGVQQLDDQVLRANGRVHLIEDVERALAILRRADFDILNIDLMVGLVGETDASFDRSLERAIELDVDSVTIYQLEIPLNTPLYRILQEGSMPAPASWEIKRRRLARGFAGLEAAGYTLRSAYTAVRDPERHRFLYQDEQYRGGDLLGIGASAFSYFGGVHYQNHASLTDYLECLGAGRSAVARAYRLSDEERCVRELVLQLKLGRVERRAFRKRFEVELAERFAEPLRRFSDAGWLQVEEDAVVLTREGLLRADRLLSDFYLEAHRGPRYS